MPVKSFEEYTEKNSKWSPVLNDLREVILSAGITETIKLGAPTYTFNGKNIISMAAFKNHFGLWFFQGALLKDRKGLLKNAQEGKTISMRQIKFKKVEELDLQVLREYVLEAIQTQKERKEIKPERKLDKALEIPKELAIAFIDNSALKAAFEN